MTLRVGHKKGSGITTEPDFFEMGSEVRKSHKLLETENWFDLSQETV